MRLPGWALIHLLCNFQLFKKNVWIRDTSGVQVKKKDSGRIKIRKPPLESQELPQAKPSNQCPGLIFTIHSEERMSLNQQFLV